MIAALSLLKRLSCINMVDIIITIIIEQWRMDVHFVHDHSCLTFVKFCLFGALHLLLPFYKLLFSSKTMFRVSLISLFFVFIVCSFCGKYFKSLGRHA